MIAAVLASGAVVHTATARQVPFTSGVEIASGYRGSSVSAGDIDGDGDPDVVTGDSLGEVVAWQENTAGDGSVWTAHTVSTSVYGGTVRATDVDGDGDMDVMVASPNDGRLLWFENTAGDGSTWTAHTISSSVNLPRDVYPADLDGDGDLDAVAAVNGTDAITWYENLDGVGSSWTSHDIVFLGPNGPSSAVATDVDGDGDLDVVYASSNDGTVGWYKNASASGDASSWVAGTISTAVSGASSVFAADVDADGAMDILAAARDDSSVAWFENDGTGANWTPHVFTSSFYQAQSVFGADVDGDGDVDAVAASYGDDAVAWFENTAGDGSTWSAHTISTVFPLTRRVLSVAAADLDADGDMDVFSAAYQGGEFAWYRNDTIRSSGRFAMQNAVNTSGDTPQTVKAADLDGDGDMDLVSGEFSTGSPFLAWHENDGTPADGGWATHTIATGAYAIRNVRIADLDGDGDADVMAASSNDGLVNWYENDGTPADGGWVSHTVNPEPGFGDPWDVYSADFDRDGNLDLVASLRSGDDLLFMLSDGTPGDGGWSTRYVSPPFSAPLGIGTVDLDRDGDEDVVTAWRDSDAITWTENDGTPGDGGWATHTISTGAGAAYAVAAADVDGDGDPDVISASRQDDKIAWYENDGTPANGGWTTHTVSMAVDNTFTVHAGDVDDDGDVDIVSASPVNDRVFWFENDGTPGDGGWITHTFDATPDFPQQVALADLDGDGDLDAMSASVNDGTVAWYPNQGGQFALPTLTTAQKIVNNASTHDLLDIEAIHRGRMGDSDAELVTLEFKFTDGSGTDLTSTEANNLIEELRIYLDDGSGVFEAGSDSIAHTIPTFNLSAGVETITFADGNANAQLPFASPKVYFAVADLTADADSQTPSAFQVNHLTASSSTGEDAVHDIPLTLEFWPNTGTGVVDTTLDSTSCQAPFDLLLSDRTVTAAVDCEAGTFIQAGDAFVVGSGGDLSLSAGETIRFTSGFHVDTGTLTVTIDPLLAP